MKWQKLDHLRVLLSNEYSSMYHLMGDQKALLCHFFITQRSAQLFDDSIHGSIEVNSLEKEIIDSPEFSRLKDIKQLGS